MSDAGLIVRKPGPMSLIQDLGRTGYFRQGMTVGGPADRLSFLWANRLCGNRANTAAVEITLGGAAFEATDHCQIAVAGGEGDISINRNAAANWCSHNLAPGDLLTIPPLIRGLRIYLAVRGGFRVSAAFGSTATVVRDRLGGIDGRPVDTGDFLPVRPCRKEPCFLLPAEKRPEMPSSPDIRLVPGWQYRQMPARLRRDFFTRRFRISRDSDRMGIRLEGDSLGDCHRNADNMISEGVIAGAVQIPPDGLPIVMGVDHQTMGGYPKIGTVATADLWMLGQLRPGEDIAITPVSAVRARSLTARILREFEATEPAAR